MTFELMAFRIKLEQKLEKQQNPNKQINTKTSVPNGVNNANFKIYFQFRFFHAQTTLL